MVSFIFMPLYEYACESCGHRFEAIQRFSDPPIEACPKCGAGVRKLVSSPAFQFKGSGWYVTDYARKTEAPKGEATKEAASAEPKDKPAADSAPKESTSKEAKAAAKES